MRPRRAALLTPPCQTPAFLQNVANSCICHTSEKSPVTPIIATDPKTRSRKSCVCHTCDPLPPPPFHSFSSSFLSSPLPSSLARGCKFAPLFSSSCRMLRPQPFSFHAFAWLPGGAGGGKPRRHAPVRTMFSFKNPCTVSPPSFPASAFPNIPNLASGRRSRVRSETPTLSAGFSYSHSHQSRITRHSPLATSPVTPVECAVTKKWG